MHTLRVLSQQASDAATLGQSMEFVITKESDSTKDNIVLVSMRRIIVRSRKRQAAISCEQPIESPMYFCVSLCRRVSCRA